MADRPNIIAPPPALPLGLLLLAAGLEWAFPLGLLPAAGTWIGWVIAAAGIALNIAAARAFLAARTHINPYRPALVVVTSGPFRLTRNPMYLGFLVFTCGLALALSLDWAIVGLPVLAAALHYGVVLREEAYLTEKFGDEYRALLTRTRRWI